MKKAVIILITALLLGGGTSLADDLVKTGSVGAQFLKIAVGSRYQGLGESSVAVVNDAYSMYWNPAGLAYVEKSNITFTKVNWVADVNLNYVALATRIEDFGVLGFSATLMTTNDMEVTTVDQPDGTGDMFSASSLALSAGVGKFLTTRLAFGMAIKYVYEKIYTESAGGIGFDFGTQLHTGFRSLRMGMNISNLGPEMKFDGPNLNAAVETGNVNNVNGELTINKYDLPLTFRLGVAYDFIDEGSNLLTVAAEAKHPNDNEQQMSLGSEYSFQDRYFLRAGYKFNYSEQGMTFGGGIKTGLGHDSELTIDYAWADMGRLESVHRFSLGINF